MDLNKPGQQHYNGGIIFVSYLISVIGAMFTLELLQRRTHIRGHYNWFLLFAAAASMGGVGIWSMHFIGNNSLTIIYNNGDQYQLSYSPGFTFASLVVAIIVMFLAFAFVGITEEAQIKRIIPSGILAGFGIVSMHYIGQVAVDFFRIENRLSFSISATAIAVCAATTALFIFFKLREQWTNQWYKRLGCAMLMAVAACGMHYTALVGTLYYPGASNSGPPSPLLGTAALIGMISGIVVLACIILFAIGAKTSFDNNASLFQSSSSKTKKKRLILDTVFFDTNGRILVRVDGIVPMKVILNEIPEDGSYGSFFTTSHPLFTRLFETTLQWHKLRNSNDEQEVAHFEAIGNNHVNNNKNFDFYNLVDDAFLTSAHELVNELRLTKLSDLGHLFDSILCTNTISSSKKSIFAQESNSSDSTGNKRRSSNTTSWLLSHTNRFTTNKEYNTAIEDTTFPTVTAREEMSNKILNRSPSIMVPQDATVIDIFNNPTPTENSANSSLSIKYSSGSEDRHIFLVKKIESNRDLVALLSIGFRFAEPAFISRTMGAKLQVPSEYILNYLQDMLQMTETASVIYKPIKYSPGSRYYSTMTSRPQQQLIISSKNEELHAGVFVGLYTLIEDQEDGEMPYIIIQKSKRYAFPMVQLIREDDTDAERKPKELSRQEKNTLFALSGTSLSKIAHYYEAEMLHSRTNKRRSSSISEPPFSPGKSAESSKTLFDLTTSVSIPTSNDKGDQQEDKGKIIADHQQQNELNTTTLSSRHQDLEESKRFIKALEKAAKSLIDMSSYGKPLASSAKLYSDIIDIPAFSLRAGPCQLILFRCHITTPGTRFAINQTLTESIKCIPYPLYRSYAYHITDIAVEKYRIEYSKQKLPSNYLAQQRLYESSAARKDSIEYETTLEASTLEDSNNLSLQEDGSTALTTYKSATNKTSSSSLTPQKVLSSLPPPPRAKRSKFTTPTGIAALDINYINNDFMPSTLKGANIPPVNPNPSVTASLVELPIALNLLPASRRFWWLDNINEETQHGI